MKKFILLVCIVAMSAMNVVAKVEKKERFDSKNYAQATFPEPTCDLGYINEADGIVRCEFEVVNTGTSPLIIINVKPSCGCTATNYNKKPIAPGEKGKIKVSYNPSGTKGGFRKSLVVKTNGREKRTTLYIEGSVIPKK